MSNIITPDDPNFNNKGPLLPPDPNINEPLIMGKNADQLTPKGKNIAYQKEMDQLKDEELKEAGVNKLLKNATSMSAYAPDPWVKTAQNVTGVDNMMTNPMWFSPLHTPQNWQIASKRREVYQWSFISGENPCFLTDYSDFSLIKIEDVYAKWQKSNGKNNDLYIQNADGEKSSINMATKRYVKKKANRIKTLGAPEPVVITNDHDCIVIKREDVKCTKGKNTSKNCICGMSSPTCLSYNCKDYETKNYKVSKIKARNINKGDYFLVPFSTEIKNSIITKAYQARYAGHLAADGSVSSNSIGCRVCMNTHEIEFVLPTVEKVYESFGFEAKLTGRRESVKEVRTGSKAIYNFSSSLVTGKYGDKKFTDEVVLLKPELQKHVLGAYIQSDGTFNKINKQIEITTHSKHLANQLLIMFYRCKILASCNKQKISQSQLTFKTKNTHRYIIIIKSSDCSKIFKYCSGKVPSFGFKEPRHNKRFFWKNYVVTPVVSNDSFDYEGPVYDVRAPKNFTVTANGIGIHQCRFFSESEPKVAAGINFYSLFPMNGFKLECKSRKVLKYFERTVKRLKLNETLKQISTEYYTLGDVFIHLDVHCPICNGSGRDPENPSKPCNHKGGTFKKIIILNPDWIEIQRTPFSDEPTIVMVPDEDLKRIVFQRQPKQLFDRIPDSIKDLVRKNQPIPLSNRTTSHLKHMPVPYGTYGTSLVRRLFTTLAYKTKIMTANWIVAERLIIPIRVVKVGSDERPASSNDIADIQNQLSQTANDPNLTIVTHNNFDYEWYGACHDEDTEVLTDKGFKKYYEVQKNDKIMNLYIQNNNNAYTKFENYQEKHVYDYDGDMICFNGRYLDTCVTPNHKMLTFNRNGISSIKRADEVKPGDRFTSVENYAYTSENDNKNYVYIKYNERIKLKPINMSVPCKEFMQFVGYYLSEGYTTYNEKKYQYWTSISQDSIKNKTYYEEIKKSSNIFEVQCHEYKKNNKNVVSFSFCNKKFSRWVKDEFGRNSRSKKIPMWVKNLHPKYLEILLKTLINGDGSRQYFKTSIWSNYNTICEQLADDIHEIAFKCGYNAQKIHRDDRWTVSWTDGNNGKRPRIKNNHITRKHYKGKVWCFTVPSGFFVTRRNGKITIQGNSGKILQVTQEMEYIGKEILDGLMLNQALLNGEMCLTPDHQILTKEGWKPITLVSKIDDICLWDDHELCYIYDKPKKIHKYENVENIYLVKSGNKILFKCTADHKIIIIPKKKQSITMRTSKHKKISANELYKSQENALTLMRDGSYIKITSVEKEKYGGDVYCFTTKTGNFVAKYDDIEFVSSNSGYQSAQVGVETLIRRLESWRHTLAEWIEENIFKPISQMQGFIDEEETEEIGETTYLYPTIKWNDLNLKDQTQWHQILMQLFDKQVISQQTLMEELGLNYDQEVKRQRWESMQAGPAVAMMQPGASGGDMGGIPMGGMGGGGAPPPAGDMMGGGVSEMGAPGGDMGLGGGAGGDMMGGGMPGSASASGKIMKKGKENKKEEEQPQQVGFIKLTQVEQKLAAILHHATSALHVNVPLVAQFPIQNPKGYKPYSLDFAIPQIKLGFEADGEIAHNSPDQIAHDKERDFLLGKRGWTILRFDDQAIDENPQDVTSTIIDFLHRAINKGKGKKFAEIKSGVVLYKQAAGKLINLKGDYNKYHDGYK